VFLGEQLPPAWRRRRMGDKVLEQVGYCCLPITDILGGAIKENPTPVLRTDPHHHSDDRFGELSPQIAMHAYHQDIPAGVYNFH